MAAILSKLKAVRQFYSDNKAKLANRVIGNNLREARKYAGLSQSEVFEATGIRKNRLSELENGHTTIDIYTLIILCDLYGCSVDYVVGRSCEPINDIYASPLRIRCVIPIIAHKITIGKSKQGNTRTPNSGCRVSFHSILCQPSF